MDVYRQPAAMDNVRLIIELLEQLSIKHSHEEAEGAVIVRDYGKDRRFLLADTPQLQFIVLCDAGKTLQIELFQAGDQGNLDGFQGFAAAGVIVPVILQSNVLRISHFQPFKEDIQRGLIGLVVLPDFPGADHLHIAKIMVLQRQDQPVEMAERKLPYLSANETNYLAFGLVTEEYHNELYEHLKSAHGEALDYKKFDTQFFIGEKGEAKDRPWRGHPNEVSIHTHVRNQIHHSADNGFPSEADLRISIVKMRSYL